MALSICSHIKLNISALSVTGATPHLANTPAGHNVITLEFHGGFVSIVT